MWFFRERAYLIMNILRNDNLGNHLHTTMAYSAHIYIHTWFVVCKSWYKEKMNHVNTYQMLFKLKLPCMWFILLFNNNRHSLLAYMDTRVTTKLRLKEGRLNNLWMFWSRRVNSNASRMRQIDHTYNTSNTDITLCPMISL